MSDTTHTQGRRGPRRARPTHREQRTTPEQRRQIAAWFAGRLPDDWFDGPAEVVVDGDSVVLTPTEYRLLATLARHQGQVLSPDQLIELAWDDPSGLAPSRVKYAVLRLRRKLGWGEGDDTPIETVRGFGYRYRSRMR